MGRELTIVESDQKLIALTCRDLESGDEQVISYLQLALNVVQGLEEI